MASIQQIFDKYIFIPRTKWLIIALYFFAMVVMLFLKKSGLHGDEGVYTQSALDLIEGKDFSFFGYRSIVPPVYPYFLAGLFFVGLSIKMVYFVQILMIIFLMFAVYNIIFIKCKSIRLGLISMIIIAVHPMIFQSTLFIGTQALFVFMLVFIIWFIIKYENSENKFFFLTIGTLLGVASLTRFASYLLIVLVIFYFLYKWRSFTFKKMTLVLFVIVGYFIVILPWSSRNTSIYNKFIFLTASNGFGVWTATCEKSDWSCWLPKSVGENPPTQSIYKSLIQQNILTESMTDIEKGEISQKEGIKEFKKNPANYFRTASMNFLRLYTNFPYPQKPSMATVFYGLFNLCILFMAFLGFLKFKKDFLLIALVVIYFTGLHTFIHIASPWYHIQTIPFLSILAAVGINYLFVKVKLFSNNSDIHW